MTVPGYVDYQVALAGAFTLFPGNPGPLPGTMGREEDHRRPVALEINGNMFDVMGVIP
jgi:hypothetical protein